MTHFVYDMWVKVAKLATRHYVRIMYAHRNTVKSDFSGFDARLAGQVSAFFATKESGRKISVLKLIKLIYLADRESIRLQGYPIISDKRYSLDHGPVNSQTLNNIKHDRPVDEHIWSEYMTPKKGHFVSPAKAFELDDFDELSEDDVAILYSVWDKFGHMSAWQLREWTHVKGNLPEYIEPPKGKRFTINIEEIYEVLDVPKAHLEEYEGFQNSKKLFGLTA